METPSIDLNNLKCFEKEVCIANDSNTAHFILAITYKCNLHCPYCYQQHDTTLNKTIMSEEKLRYILGTIDMYKHRHPKKTISIGLFGGKPLQPETIKIVEIVLKFCVKNLIALHITTNGTNLSLFLKLFIMHRNIISSINSTIDSMFIEKI